MKKLLIPILLIAFALSAHAVVIGGSSFLNESNTPGETGPFGVVQVLLNTNTQVARITFHSSTTAIIHNHFIDDQVAALNFSTTINDFTLILDPFFKDVVINTPTTVSTFGLFNFVMDNHDGTLTPTIIFSVHNTGAAWTSVNQILAFNTHNVDAAGHMKFGDGSTGFVAESGRFTTPVPDAGSTVSLFGFGLLGLAAFRRKLSC